jgi:hypothetical protein
MTWGPSASIIIAILESMGAYYYAGGRKIDLVRDDDHVAVDQKAAERAGVDARSAVAGAGPARGGGGVVLAEKAALDSKLLAALRKAGALQPVYKRERAIVVALPEVRIEFDHPRQRRAVKTWLSRADAPKHAIVEETDDWIVVRPLSGNGKDALAIANDVYEKAHPAAASVRFVQFVPKPGVSR